MVLVLGGLLVAAVLAGALGMVLLIARRSSPEARQQRAHLEADAVAASAHAYAAAVAHTRAQADATVRTAIEAGTQSAAERERWEAQRRTEVELQARQEAERVAQEEEQRRAALAQATYAPVAPAVVPGSPVAQHLEQLACRFGPDVARRIVAAQVWRGQTEEMLVEALGRPIDVDDKLMATRLRRVFKYLPLGGNRFAIRIILDNGVVVGWEDNR
jgi:hypothetical protein